MGKRVAGEAAWLQCPILVSKPKQHIVALGRRSAHMLGGARKARDCWCGCPCWRLSHEVNESRVMCIACPASQHSLVGADPPVDKASHASAAHKLEEEGRHEAQLRFQRMKHSMPNVTLQ